MPRIALGMTLASMGGPPLIVNGTNSVATANAQTLTTTNAIGGVTFSLTTNAAGNSTCDAAGHYVAGDTGGGGTFAAVVDRVTATDSVGRTAFLDITVVATLPSDVTWTVILDANAIAGKNDGDTVTTEWTNTGSAGGSSSVKAGFASVTYKTGANGINSKAVIRNARAGSHALQMSTLTPGAIMTSTLYYTYAVLKHNDGGAFGTGSNTPALLFGASGFFSALGISATSAKHYWGYNWDGNEDDCFDASNTLATGSAVLLGQRHKGGNIELQLGGAAGWSNTVASGTTSNTGGAIYLGHSASAAADVDIAIILATQADLTASQQTRTVNYLRSQRGATL